MKAASKLVVVGICPFIAKLGITAGANIDTILQSGPVLLLHGFGNLLGPLLALPVAIVDTVKLDGLTKGTKYQLKGWQMLKEENTELLILKTVLLLQSSCTGSKITSIRRLLQN